MNRAQTERGIYRISERDDTQIHSERCLSVSFGLMSMITHCVNMLTSCTIVIPLYSIWTLDRQYNRKTDWLITTGSIHIQLEPEVYIRLAESAKSSLFDQNKRDHTKSMLFLWFSTDLNKIFNIKYIYIWSTRENNSWIYQNDPVQKCTYTWFLILCC